MGLLIVIIFGVTALLLPGCLGLIGVGIYLAQRGAKRKSEKERNVGICVSLAGVILLVPAFLLALWLHNAGAF